MEVAPSKPLLPLKVRWFPMDLELLCYLSPSPGFCTADQWELDPDELTLGQEIGSGQFGLVLEGWWKKKKVAVKMIRDGCMSEDDLQEEARVMM